MGFFSDLKEWYQEQKRWNDDENALRKIEGKPTKSIFERVTGDFSELVVEPTKEDFTELKQEIKNENQKLKNEFKAAWKDASPPIGELVEGIDKGLITLGNFFDGKNPIRVVARTIGNVSELKIADHLYVQGLPPLYTHHGIYINDGKVLHYSDFRIQVATLDEFSNGRTINVVDSPLLFSPEEAVGRAFSRVNESSYDLVFNNCEHFVLWCRCGDNF